MFFFEPRRLVDSVFCTFRAFSCALQVDFAYSLPDRCFGSAVFRRNAVCPRCHVCASSARGFTLFRIQDTRLLVTATVSVLQTQHDPLFHNRSLHFRLAQLIVRKATSSTPRRCRLAKAGPRLCRRRLPGAKRPEPYSGGGVQG